MLDVLLPGRFKLDTISKTLWTCDTQTNVWCTDDTTFGTLLNRLKTHEVVDFLSAPTDFKTLLCGYKVDYFSKLKTSVSRTDTNHDSTFHETRDRSLAPGMLAFRNGKVLDLSGPEPALRDLAPEDHVSVTIERDLPEFDTLAGAWSDDAKYEELKVKLSKNFSDEVSMQQVLERLAWAVLHGRPNDCKFWLELAGTADGGKTMLLEVLAKVLPGMVKKTNISLFSTFESKKSSGPNEALAGLRGLRIAFAEEPSDGLVLDGAFLKDLCGGVQIETSRKYEHQISFDITFHGVFISNNDTPMDIKPREGTVEKRVGYRMLNRFAASGDTSIDNIHVFAREEGLRERIGRDYWLSTLRLLHEYYQQVLEHDFDTTDTVYKMNFPPPDVARGIQYYVDLYEVHEVGRGHKSCLGMPDIYSELENHGIGGEFTQQQFFSSGFKASMKAKIESWRAANDITGTGGPRIAKAPGGSGKDKFYGIRLPD